MPEITLPKKNIPVKNNVDICVLGGSCTGVFAAVRAARLGADVVIVEKQNCFGGTATAGNVNIWHSLYDNDKQEQIIGGLTVEVIERLKKRQAIISKEKELGRNDYDGYILNTAELKIELDELIKEENIKPYLHTQYICPYLEEDELRGVVLNNKSGMFAVKAEKFIDATGDGDLCYHLNIPAYYQDHLQPPTSCAKIKGMNTLEKEGFDFQKALDKHGSEFGLKDDWGWNKKIPGTEDIKMHADTHVFNTNAADGDQLTEAEIEGRRQIRAYMDLVRKYAESGENITLLDLPATIGIRESRHIKSQYQVTEEDILYGKEFADAIGQGTYRVDIHHSDRPGITFKYLDGKKRVFNGRGEADVSRWREKVENPPTYYQIPFRSLIPRGRDNVIFCGRMIDADSGAFSALRVMVNTNQMGEAAGVAAVLSLETDTSFKS
ncbi:MAG: FAD-dependent oxidoreductase, partial [bacterium]